MVEPGLYLAKVGGKNWGLHLVDQSMEKYLQLKRFFLHKETDRRLNHFFQSDSDPFHQVWEQDLLIEAGKTFNSSYLFIEFWTEDHDLILNESMKVAEKLGLELRTDFY